MTEWTKCIDKPPEDDKDLLIWDGNYMAIGTLLYVEDSSYVFIVGGTTFDATHWAECPEGPNNKTLDINKIIEIHATKLLKKRNEILDLFCKTFIVCQNPRTIEEVKHIVENYKIVHNITDPLIHTYKLDYDIKND